MTALTQDRNSLAPDDTQEMACNRTAGVTDAPVLQALTALCRTALTGNSDELADALAGMGPPDRLIELVDRSRMWSACEMGFMRGDAAVPAFVELHARAARGRSMLVNTRVLGLARMAFPCLARLDIPAIAFKGPFHQRQLHGDWFTRRSNDLDLLVPRSRFEDALAALEAIGFKAHHGTSQWWKFSLGEVHLVYPGGGVIDLHHRLQQPGCPAPRHLGEFISAADMELLGETSIAIPSFQHALLISALNFCKELFYRKPSARYAFDFATGALLLPPEAHEEFVALVRRQGLEGPVGFTMAACESLFGPLQGMPELAARWSARPPWTKGADFARLVFAPECVGICWPRRRTFLWQLCGGEATARCSLDFAEQAGRIAISEMLRRTFTKIPVGNAP